MPAQTGFIDHGEGTNIRTAPAELPSSRCLTSAPLPPGTRVVVIGPHPQKPQWSHVVARSGDRILRGVVQGFRVTTDLPEPTATLYHVKPGDRLEPIAARIYRQAIEPGHDLRFFENVVLYVNQTQKKTRAGIRRATRATSLWGIPWRESDVELVAGHRIWLVSVAFANQLQKVVPSGSITGGALASAKKVWQHLTDIGISMRMSPKYLREVAGEYADALSEHLPEIIAMMTIFIELELFSAFLAATPTGVGQLGAALIQMALAMFGARGIVDAGFEAARHAEVWLTLAWKANGDAEQIALASKSFLRMVVSVAIAFLSALGMKSNFGRGLKIAENIKITPPQLVMTPALVGNGGAVAVPIFTPGSITSTGVVVMSGRPTTGFAAALNQGASGSSSRGSPEPKSKTHEIKDAELEELLKKAPNWEQLKKFVGRHIPAQGTPEFAAFKRELEAAGYQLDVMKDAHQPFRVRRINGKALEEYGSLTVTKEGMIVLNAEGSTRISVFSRYRKNYLDWVERTHGPTAREAVAARIGASDQLHHLIPDLLAQSHPLIQEALKRLKGYTIDRGTNIIDMPVTKNMGNKIIHLGSHPEYNKYVTSKLQQELRNVTSGGRIPLSKVNPSLIEKAILKIEKELRQAIETWSLPDKVLKELVEDGLPVGKKLAMLELRRVDGSFTA